MAKREGPLYCRRCVALVPSIRPWHGWKPAWTAWKVGVVGVIAMTPLLASDFCVMLPSMMVYLTAGGPLRAYAKTRPVCRRCSLELTEGETALQTA
jgi:hypothetical protein